MKKRFGDRKDGRKVRDLDGMHNIMLGLMPKRCDSDVYMNVKSENDCLYDVQGGNKILRYEYSDNMTAYWFNQNKNGLYLKLESPETIGIIEFK